MRDLIRTLSLGIAPAKKIAPAKEIAPAKAASTSSAAPTTSLFEPRRNNPFAVTGFVLGVASVFLYFVVIIPILGIVFSAIGLGTFKNDTQKNRWMAVVGLALSTVFTLMFFFYLRPR